VRPRLLAEAGRADDVPAAVREANTFSGATDPWLMLEVAWRELGPPRSDRVELGHGDYGAARDFLSLRPEGRWSRGHAELRTIPTTPASRYRVTLVMGSPEPSPLAAPEVRVRVAGGEEAWFTLSRDLRPYSLETAAPPGVPPAPLHVHLYAPTWRRWDEPAEQGAFVRLMTVAPAGG
jgi:hypothetical protein